MTHRKAALRLCLALFVALTVSFSVLADTVRLKDGSIIKGRIISFDNGRFIVVIGEGTSRRRELTFAADEIESIQFDNATQPVATSPQVVNTSAPRNTGTRISNTDTTTTSRSPGESTQTATDTGGSARVKRPAGQPIALNVRVLGDDTTNGWTNSGWVVKRGQRIKITATGNVSLGNGRSTGPGGMWSISDSQKLLPAAATGALIAVIGDDNNDFLFIGTEREFTAERDGALFLGVNEGNLNDNSGAYEVKVEIMPG